MHWSTRLGYKAVYNEVERMLHNFVEENIQKCKLIEELRINIL